MSMYTDTTINLTGRQEYIAMDVQPRERSCEIAIHDGGSSQTLTIRLDGRQFEMLRNLLNDYAAQGCALTTYSIAGLIAEPRHIEEAGIAA